MVVLEGGGIINSNNNQYLQPDYLSPLPTTLDSKKSPLALLAQTCSQIGADSSNNKPLLSTLDKQKKQLNNNETILRSSPKQPEKRTSPIEKLAFKPYEINVLSKRTDDIRPSSKNSTELEDKKSTSNESRAPSTKSVSSSSTNDSSPSSDPDKCSDRKESTSSSGASPIIRSGLEVLQGTKDPLSMYKNAGLSPSLNGPLSSLYGPAGADPHLSNPAFRPPFAGGPYSHHAMMLAGLSQPTSPYLSYTRIKTPSGGETVVPVCKDPYCTGCQYSLHNPLLNSSAAACPSGCTQCDHQKFGFAAMAMSSLGPQLSASPYSQLGSPYICNWIVGESYCGKRYRTSEELLQHLRTHTSSESSHSSPLLNPLFAASLQRLGYPNGPLSPLSSRYHPYAKPGALPGSLPGIPPYGAFGSSAFNPYYSPYLYGQRLGPSTQP